MIKDWQADLVEGKNSVPSTHSVWLSKAWDSSSRGSDILSCSQQAPGTGTHVHKYTLHINKNQSSKLKSEIPFLKECILSVFQIRNIYLKDKPKPLTTLIRKLVKKTS